MPWCCAPSLQKDNELQHLNINAGKDTSLYHEQPRQVNIPRMEPISTRPTTSHSMSQHLSGWVNTGGDLASRASTRKSFSSMARPWTSQSRRRPTISAPTDFRRVESVPTRRRRSFRPLELSIYMPENRLSPLPDFTLTDWSQKPAELENPTPAHVTHTRNNSSICSTSTNFTIKRKPVSSIREPSPAAQSRYSMASRSQTLAPFDTIEPVPLPRTTLPRPVTSAQASILSPFAVPHTASPARARSNTEPPPPLNSRPSFRRQKSEIDDAIRELNTIVEERRASNYRATPSPRVLKPIEGSTEHIPAIAPTRTMHVRAETLSDIGSAFSMPFVSKPLPFPPGDIAEIESLNETEWHARLTGEESRDGAFEDEKTLISQPVSPRPSTRGSMRARLSSWARRSLPSSPIFASPPKFPPPPLPTAFSRPRTQSGASSHQQREQQQRPAPSTQTSFYQCQDLSANFRPHGNPSISSMESMASLSSSTSTVSDVPPSMSMSENTYYSSPTPSTPRKARSLEAKRTLDKDTAMPPVGQEVGLAY